MTRNVRGAIAFACATVLVPPAMAGDLYTKLAKQLSRGVAPLEKRTVAVLALPYHDGKVSSGSSIISERLTTELVGQRRIKVVERRLIRKLLQEKNLSETGALDPASAKAIGSVLGVEAIVTGTLIDLETNETEVNARMINAQSGEILAAAKAVVERTWSDRPVSPEPPRRKSAARKPSAAPTEKAQEFEAEEAGEERPLAIKGGKSLSNESFPPGRRRYDAVDMPPRRSDAMEKDGPEYEKEPPNARLAPPKRERAEKEDPSIVERRLEKFHRTPRHEID